MIQKHAHKLRRHKYRNKEEIYFCTLDDCDFKISCKLALGKTNICWRCGKYFQMNEIAVRLAKPHCMACTKHKGEQPDDEAVDELVAVAKDTSQLKVSITKHPIPTDLRSRMARMLDDVASSVANQSSGDGSNSEANEDSDGDII